LARLSCTSGGTGFRNAALGWQPIECGHRFACPRLPLLAARLCDRWLPLHHPRSRLRTDCGGSRLAFGERAGGDRLDGGDGRGGEARNVRGAGDEHVDGAANPNQLLPLNPAFKPITLEPEDANALAIIAEFVAVAS
jgi:hypothetical protein